MKRTSTGSHAVSASHCRFALMSTGVLNLHSPSSRPLRDAGSPACVLEGLRARIQNMITSSWRPEPSAVRLHIGKSWHGYQCKHRSCTIMA